MKAPIPDLIKWEENARSTLDDLVKNNYELEHGLKDSMAESSIEIVHELF